MTGGEDTSTNKESAQSIVAVTSLLSPGCGIDCVHVGAIRIPLRAALLL